MKQTQPTNYTGLNREALACQKKLHEAAPLLLEALKDAFDMIHRIDSEPQYFETNECFLRRDKISAAIAATQQ